MYAESATKAEQEAAIDNALVRQKNKILDLINKGHALAAMERLEMVADLWRAAGYEYKTRELLARMVIHGAVDERLERLYKASR